ncbi:MAG: hypothetical protein MK066_02330 [Crocinitomicaceae bacterium]|nr:hypothetical protein [Crocinitomicaceae bacterium]
MKFQSFLALIILIGIHLVFLHPIFISEIRVSPYYLGTGILFLVLLCLGYFFQFKKHSNKQPTHLFSPIYVIIGGLSTYYLNIHLELGPVIAAGCIGVAASFIPTFIKHNLASDIPVATYCGTFVGMSSPIIVGSPFFILFASSVAGLILLLTKDVLLGVGGKLGTIAFGGVLSALLFFYLW